jgi:hypothetical protein
VDVNGKAARRVTRTQDELGYARNLYIRHTPGKGKDEPGHWEAMKRTKPLLVLRP